jgi:CDP-glucose 4,6-dehydratase
VLCALLRGRRPVIRSDGSPLRDYIYIEDAIEAFLALAGWLDETPRAEPGERAFNFGADRPLTVLEMAHRIRIAAAREDLEPIIADTAVGEIDAQHLDWSRAREVLGWRCRHELDAALRATARWYRRYLNLPDAAAPEPASADPSSQARHGDLA